MSIVEKVQNLKETECIVDVLHKEVSTHECKECGKCVFGYEGVSQLEMILKDITEKKGKPVDMDLMKELSELMRNQSMCEKDEDLAKAISLALKLYPTDFEDHIGKRGCKAGVCSKFMTYHVIASKCVGCMECLRECDEDAILGKKKFVHVIVQDECTQCGACMDACDENAIVRAGAVKPKCPTKPIPCKR